MYICSKCWTNVRRICCMCVCRVVYPRHKRVQFCFFFDWNHEFCGYLPKSNMSFFGNNQYLSPWYIVHSLKAKTWYVDQKKCTFSKNLNTLKFLNIITHKTPKPPTYDNVCQHYRKLLMLHTVMWREFSERTYYQIW